MAFTDIELHKIKKVVGGLCQKRSPEHLRDRVRVEYKIHGHDVVLYEVRPRWDDPTQFLEAPIAKLKLVRSRKIWRLFWERADMKWHKYEPLDSSKNITDLVNEIDADPYGCFWG